MNGNNKSGGPDNIGQNPANENNGPKPLLHTVRGTERRSQPSRRNGESHAGDATAAIVSREKSAGVREDAAHSREDAAFRREGAAHAREEEAHVREDAATSRERAVELAEVVNAPPRQQLTVLRQANEHLVIASIEAQRLAEQLQTAKSELDHLAHHDVLTNLPNRLLLQDRLTQAVELARRQNRQLALLFLDLDQFKHINDSLGHAIGDQLLQSVAQRLLNCVRHSDTISRQGGDEFVLLLPFIEHADEPARAAMKILAALALPHHIGRHSLHIGVSIGISIYPDDGEDAESLMKSADIAMYYVKESGRNNFRFFERGMNTRATHRQSIEADLRQALARQEFTLCYQPQVNLKSGKIVGAEALIRWQHPQHGVVPPSQFVAVAEDCGLIVPIGRWALREACRQACAWRDAGLPRISVAVNTSASEFHATGFFDNVRATLEETGLEPRYLELELTESVLMRSAESTDRMLRELAAIGIKLVVDDFGTGYSSLSYLRQFPISTLKIDQSFVRQMTCNPDDATLVKTVINMGKSLNQCVVAEGVETLEQYTLLLAQGCDEGQGFYFGPPLPGGEFAELLVRGSPNPDLSCG